MENNDEQGINGERDFRDHANNDPILSNNSTLPKKQPVRATISEKQPVSTAKAVTSGKDVNQLSHAEIKEAVNKSTGPSKPQVQQNNNDDDPNQHIGANQFNGSRNNTIVGQVMSSAANHSLNVANTTGTLVSSGSSVYPGTLGRKTTSAFGPKNSLTTVGPILFHSTRPPDTAQGNLCAPLITDAVDDVGMIDSEEFVDAHEQGDASSESEMEVVMETPLH